MMLGDLLLAFALGVLAAIAICDLREQIERGSE